MVTGRDGLSAANGDLIVIYVEIPSLVINCIVTTAIFQGAERERERAVVTGQKNLNLPQSV